MKTQTELAMRNEVERKAEKRSSGRQPIPEVAVELRRDTYSENPAWVCSAVDIGLRGMRLRLPPWVGLGESLDVVFTLADPRTSFGPLRAIVLGRESDDIGVLGFEAWPLEAKHELAVWMRRRADADKTPHSRPSTHKGPVVPIERVLELADYFSTGKNT